MELKHLIWQSGSSVLSLPIKNNTHNKQRYRLIMAALTRSTENISPKPAADQNETGRLTTTTNKTVYNDTWFDQLAINHLSQSVQAATGLRNSKTGFESLVQATMDASKKYNLVQQRELVLQALDRAIPRPILNLIRIVMPASKFSREYFAAFTTIFFVWLIGHCEVRESVFNGRKEKNVVHIKKCRFLEETNCVGMCTNLCKLPSQTFIKESLGMPINMVPNFDDMSCEMIFGEEPPAISEDPVFKQPCYKLCMSSYNASPSYALSYKNTIEEGKANKRHVMKCPS